MNLLDKAIRAISPERALKRFEARRKLEILNSGYSRHGGSYAKKSLIGWLSGGSDADADIVDNLETLRNRSRDLYMGSPLATGALKTVRTNVVGSGLALNAQVDAKFLGLTEEQAKEWEENTEREWRLWSESVNCDAERRQTFFQLQSLVLLSALMSGDVFVTMPIIPRKGCAYDLRIGLIEADRVCDPLNASTTANILGGIEVGTYGETVAYWVAKHHPGAIPRIGQDLQQEWKRVLAFGTTTGRRNVLHIMADVERPAQRRGVPMLAPVIEALKQLSRYSEAELMAAVVSGMFTVFVKSNTPDSPLATAFNPAMQVDKAPNAYEMGNGSIVALDEGEEVQIADPSRPNPNFDPFVIAICRQIGAALEIPYELLVKNFTASYSASRASLLEAWKMFRMRREWLVGNFCQPIYEEWLTEAVLKGRVQAPGFFDDQAVAKAYMGCTWNGPARTNLDAKKEIEAAILRVQQGISTNEQETAQMTGGNWRANMRQRKSEMEKMKEVGLNEQT